MEARPPAENRHGGAPRGERPASWDAPRLTERGGRASQARQQHKCACRRSARPSLGRVRRDERPTRAHECVAGTKKATLFDIVRFERCIGEHRTPGLCESRAPALSCPGRASGSERRAGTQGPQQTKSRDS
jgi:hypothetical protein